MISRETMIIVFFIFTQPKFFRLSNDISLANHGQLWSILGIGLSGSPPLMMMIENITTLWEALDHALAIVEVFNRINKLYLSSCGPFQKRSIKILNFKIMIQKVLDMLRVPDKRLQL